MSQPLSPFRRLWLVVGLAGLAMLVFLSLGAIPEPAQVIAHQDKGLPFIRLWLLGPMVWPA